MWRLSCGLFLASLCSQWGCEGKVTGNSNLNNNQNNQSVCGDSVVDDGEECDLGGANSDSAPDTCRTDCRLPWCGDSVQDTAEGCDDGNADNADACLSACASSDDCCQPNVCGDSFVNRADNGSGGQVEVCDDGNTQDGDDCAGNCQKDYLLCGDGTVDQGEECDNGLQNSDVVADACRSNCTVAHCGDGVTDTAEQCDDATANSDTTPDACRSDCGWPTCGDGILDGGFGEDCDDATANSDTPNACRSDCDLPACGDAIVDDVSGEVCDEGAANSGLPNATCRSDCLARRCGDAITDDLSGEDCDQGVANSDVTPNSCRSDCQDPSCGDGILDNLFSEQCDDASANSDVSPNACRSDCLLARCGDGVTDDLQGEQCDDAAANGDGPNESCRLNCLPRRCGDGIADDSFGEACDDGVANGDATPNACRTSCQLPVCGDGVLDNLYSEACDDAAANSDSVPNACRTTCQLAVCGDGVVDDLIAETCDDGDATDWDGCTSCAVTEFQVNTYVTDRQEYPDVAVALDGSFGVVWESRGQDAGASDSGIYVQLYDAQGVARGGEIPVNTYTTNSQAGPHIAMDAAGNFVVIWVSNNQDGSGGGVYGQLFDAAGSPVGAEFRVNTTTLNAQREPDVAMSDAGSFVVVWESSGMDGSGDAVVGRRYSAAGAPLSGEFIVNTTTASTQEAPAVASAADARFVVVWHGANQDGDGYGIFGQRFDIAGSPAGVEFQVNTITASDQLNPDVAMRADGRFVVVWRSFGIDGDLDGVAGQRFDGLGNKLGGELLVNTYASGNQNSQRVALADDGRFAVLWMSAGQDGDQGGVYGQRYAANGAPSGGEFLAHVYVTSSQQRPAVAMIPTGGFVAVWESYLQDGNVEGVFAQRFSSAGMALGIGPTL